MNFATFKPLELQLPFTEASDGFLGRSLNLAALGRRQILYFILNFAESCVFSKQSPPPRFVRTPVGALLFPKLRN